MSTDLSARNLLPELADDKVGVAMPVNCCTMARKLVGSVLRTVVWARLVALVRRRAGRPTRASGFKWVVVAPVAMAVAMGPGVVAEAMVVVTTVASDADGK